MAECLTLCGDPGDESTWRLGVLRDPNGSGGSLHVHDNLQTGDIVRVRGPRDNVPLVPTARYLFVAAGIGITPILPMIHAADQAGADWQLVYGGRQQASMAFLDRAGRPRRPGPAVAPGRERVPAAGRAVRPTPPRDIKIYCRGPEPWLAAVEQATAAWPAGALHVERFVAKPLTRPVRSEAFDVQLARTGTTLTVPPTRSVLSVLQEAGVRILSSCGEGTCGTCETIVLDGVPDHRDSVLDAAQRQANDCMMVCVSCSCTDQLVLDL